MMQEDVLDRLLDQVEVIKDNPYYDKIKSFLVEIKSLLVQVNESISDNVEKMPGAAKKIYKVTEATEAATNEILDAVDSVLLKVDSILNNYNKLTKIIQEDRVAVLDTVNTAIQFIEADVNKEEVVAFLMEFRDKYENKNEKSLELNSVIEDSREILNNISNDSTQIMMSSQVQDITSQQLAAVNHTLETIQGKLKKILFAIDVIEKEGLMPANEYNENENSLSTMHRDIVFDPNAINSIINKETKQDEIDALMQKHAAGAVSEEDLIETVSNDDIDDLLNNFASYSTTDETVSDDMSQDDINALFGM